MTEHEIAVELVRWIGYHIKKWPWLELFHHVRNEGKPGKHNSEGILAGIPDYHLPVARGGYCGFWLELKSHRKKPTKKQREMMKKLRAWGNYTCWTDNLQTAIRYVEEYCRLPNKKGGCDDCSCENVD
jgi:hypothetical protein